MLPENGEVKFAEEPARRNKYFSYKWERCEWDKKKWCAATTKRKQMSRKKYQKEIARENNCEFVRSKRSVAAAVAAMGQTT